MMEKDNSLEGVSVSRASCTVRTYDAHGSWSKKCDLSNLGGRRTVRKAFDWLDPNITTLQNFKLLLSCNLVVPSSVR